MPAVTATHGWITVAEARKQLEAEGLLVAEHGNAIYVRQYANSFPNRLYSKNGLVSPRTVKRLVKAAQERAAMKERL